jgi:hypothetical protein
MPVLFPFEKKKISISLTALEAWLVLLLNTLFITNYICKTISL